jgi:hypothetical protein
MKVHTSKNKDNQSRSVANTVSQKQSLGESVFQFVDNRPEAIVQQKQMDVIQNTSKAYTIQKKENNTGLPDNLKSGIEQLSGIDMSDTKVHYNSSKPAQLHAHAYAKGTDIHLASGQEKYLPHEAWHVVQQKQGRVKPTIQMKGKERINNDKYLEKEADIMGDAAQKIKSNAALKLNLQLKEPKNIIIQQRVSESRGRNGDTVYDKEGNEYELIQWKNNLWQVSDGFSYEERFIHENDLYASKPKKKKSEGKKKRKRQSRSLLPSLQKPSSGLIKKPVKPKKRNIKRTSQNSEYHLMMDEEEKSSDFDNEHASNEAIAMHLELHDESEWETKYQNFIHGSTWITVMEKIKDILDQEEENIETSEDFDTNETEMATRKDFVRINKEWANKKEGILTNLSINIIELNASMRRGHQPEPRDEITGIEKQIAQLKEECETQLNYLYEELKIPNTDGGGSRSPRKFGEANGTLYYYGNLPKKMNIPEDGVHTQKLGKRPFKQLFKDTPDSYKISFGVKNAFYDRKSYDKIQAPTGVFRHKNESDKLNQVHNKQEKYKAIAKELDDDFDQPKLHQEKIYTSNARRQDRGDGQYKEMNSTNAAAYAFGSNLDKSLETNWEWLHIRGAGLGGDTDSTNLIAGTYSANSHMIPYENQVKTMSAYTNGKQPLHVSWDLEPGKAKFSGHSITITVYAPNGLFNKADFKEINAIPKNKPWIVKFNPLKAVVFDKFLRGAAWMKFKQHTKSK